MPNQATATDPNATKTMTIGVVAVAGATEVIAVTVVIAGAEVAVAEVVEAAVNEAAGVTEATEEIEKIMTITAHLQKEYLCLISLKKKFPVELLVQPKMIKKSQKLIKTNETNGILIKMI